MAEFAKEDLDAIVQAIGFGIVSDFRSLQSAMNTLADQSAENNRLLGNVNENLQSTDRTLERLEKDIYRQIDARQFTALENAMEKKSKASSRRADQILGEVQKSLENLRREAAKGNKMPSGGSNESGDANSPSEIDKFIQGVQPLPVVGGGDGGSNLTLPSPAGSGMGGLAMTGGIIAGAAIGAGATLLMNDDTSTPVGDLAPTEPIAAQPPQISATGNKGTATQTPTASTTGAVSAATQTVGAVTTSAGRKALEKITNKLAEWVNKNPNNILAAIGGKQNVKIFGQLVGGTFTFNKYLSDDSWTGLGEEYVQGNMLTPAQTKEQNAAYVASVVVNLAILAYLACRDVYTRENYRDITSGLVQNFDDLGSSEKFQFIKNAGGHIENYVNKLISETKTSLHSSATSSYGLISSAEAAIAPQSSPDLAPTVTAPIDGGGGNEANDNEMPDDQTGAGGGGGGGDGGGGGAADTGGYSPGGGIGGGESSGPSTSPDQSLTSTGGTGDGGGQQQTDADVAPGNEAMSVDVASIPGNESASGSAEMIMKTIKTRESGGDYSKQNPDSTASGGYQFIDETWQGLTSKYGIGTRYSRAVQAPPEVQDAVAKAYISEILDQNNGDVSKIPLVWYTGNAEGRISAKALRKNRGLTPRAYQSMWMKDYYRITGARRADASSTQQSDDNSESAIRPTVAAAQGALITPLPKSPTDTINLAPPKMDAGEADEDEDDVTASSAQVDARPKTYSANPYDEMKNKIGFYMDYMTHHFGHLSEEFDLHTSGELTAEESFKRTMSPLGR